MTQSRYHLCRHAAILATICFSSNGYADDWSSVGKAFAIGLVALAFYSVLLAISFCVGLWRIVKRDWRSGTSYFLYSFLVLVAAMASTYLIASLPFPPSLQNSVVFLYIVVFGVPGVAWAVYQLRVLHRDKHEWRSVRR
jgi:hypothetical protein